MMKSKITKTLALAAAVFGLQAFTNTAMADDPTPPSILNEAYLWLDASQGVTTDGSGMVTSWTSRNSGGKTATSYTQDTQVTAGPTVLTGVLGGKNVVDFGAARSHKDLQFEQTTTIRTVFMVAAVATDSNNIFFLGDNYGSGSSKAYDFHRGSNGYYFDGTHGKKFAEGTVRRNGVTISSPSSTTVPTSYGLYTLVSTGNATANCICQDRNEANRNGGKKVAELIIFNSVLSDSDRAAVEQYLMTKWLSGYPEQTMLYRFGLDSNGDKSTDSTGKQTTTTEGTMTHVSSGMKFDTGCVKLSSNGSYVIDNIETRKDQGWTLSFWFSSDVGTWKDLLAFAIGNKMGKFERNGGSDICIYQASSLAADKIEPSNNPVASGFSSGWNHLALVSTSAGFDVYLNGVKKSSVTQEFDSGLTKVIIGTKGYNGDGRTSNALVDDVSVFNWSMTSAQVNKIKNSSTHASMDLFAASKATVTGDINWSELDWNPSKPASGEDVKLTRSGDAENATLTMDETISVGTVTVTSESDKNLTLAPDSGKTFSATFYDFSGANGKAMVNYATDATPVTAGADTVLTSVNNPTLTIDANKKLTVKGGTVQETTTSIASGGTLNFDGGTATTPVLYEANGGSGSTPGKLTVASGAYLKLRANNNKVFNVTGAGAAVSTNEICKASGGLGMSAGTQFRNITLIPTGFSGNNHFWVEQTGSMDATVNLDVRSQIKLNNNYSPTIGSLFGSGAIVIQDGSSSSTVTIKPSMDATYSGTSSAPFVIDASDYTQTLSGAYTGALTVNAGGKVKLTGEAQPSSTTSAGYVEVAAGKLTGNVTFTGGTLNITTDTTGQQSYTITEGTFAQGGATVKLNGTPIADLGYVVKGNKIIKPFEATIDGNKTWSELWTGTAPGTDDAVLLNVTAAATLTINASTTVASIKVTSTGSNKLTIASPTNLHATTYDFSSAAGKVAFDYTGITTTTTLLSGTITGGENIDTTGVPEGSSLIVTPTEIRLVFNGQYQKFSYGKVYSWVTTGSGPVDLTTANGLYQEFDIVALTNKTTVYNGQTKIGSGAKDWFWTQFAYATGVGSYSADNPEIIRLPQDSCLSISGDYGPMAFGGIIAEPGSNDITFENTESKTRSNFLGDPTAQNATFFDIGANVTFNRHGVFYLAGTLTFDIANGKTFNLNSSQTSYDLALFNTVAAGESGAFGATTPGGTLVMKGDGTLQVNNLKALGSTLDYTNIPLSRQTAYISGTLTINDSTVIKLPANLPENTPFKMATTLSGGTDGNRTIYLGNEPVLKDVTFNASEGTISYADVTTYVAKIGDTKYVTLAAALDAVQPDQTITLLMNCNEAITTAKTFTFAPAGFTYGGAVTVNEGGVLTIDGGDACTIASVVTLNNGGKLITKGTLSLSSGSNTAASGSTLEVSTGTLTCEAAQKGLKCHIIIDSGAKYVQGAVTRSTDQIDYTANMTIDVYGTLDMGSARWTLKGGTVINVYPGAVVEGDGKGTEGALDGYATAPINAKKNGGTGGTATISAKLRPRTSAPAFDFNVEEGMTLVLNGSLSDYTNGFRKDGAGTLLISSAYGFTTTITLAGGTVKIADAGALGTSPIAFSGGTLDLNGQTLTGKTASGNGTITNTSDTQASYNGIPVAKGKQLDIESGAVSVTLGDSDTFTLSSVPAENAIKFHGSGKVIYSSTSVPTLPTGIWASDWKGTFKYEGLDGSVNDWNWSSYYNGTLSKFEFAGNMTGGYLPRLNLSFGELILTGTIKTTNGYTKLTDDTTYVCYDFTKLSGSGTFNSAVTTTAKPIYWFKDASEFTGTFTSSGSSGGMRFVLGSEAGGTYSGTVPAERAVSFAGEVTLNKDVTFSAVGGVVAQSGAVITIPAGVTAPKSSTAMTFEGGSSVVLADKDSKLAVGAAVTVASDVTIPVKITNAAGLAAGKELITWTGTQPAGSFSFSVESGVSIGQTGFKATKSDTALAVAVDDTTTYYEVGGATERQPTTFDNQWLTNAKITGEPSVVQTKLDTKNAYDVKASDAYLMGYAANEVETAAIVLASQPASLSDKVRLVIQGVPAVSARRNGAVVTYTVKSSTSQTMEDPEKRDIGESTMVDMALPESGVLYYRIEATIDISGTKSEPIPAVVPSADIVAPGMPLLTEPGAKFAAALGTTTVTEATASMTFQLGGVGVYEGQEYHLEVNEANESPLQTKSLKLTTSSASNEAYGMVAKVLSDKTVTFDFGHEVGVGTTCKLTLIGEGGAANGNVVVKSPAMTGTTANMEEVIVSTRVGWTPYDDGIATMAAPAMPQQFRIPAIATDGKGEVIACYDCRYGESDLGATWDSGNGDGTVYSGIDIAENYSSDNGKTFDHVHLGVDVANMRDQTGAWIGGYANRNNGNYLDKDRDIGDVCILYNPNDQKYWMMGLTGGGLVSAGTDAAKNDVVLYTRAKGKDSKWGDRRSVKQQILTSLGKTSGTISKGFLEGPGHGIVTTHDKKVKGATAPAGTLIFPIQCFFTEGTHAGAAYSTDGGTTWKATSLTDTNLSPQENCVMELDDGTWYMCTKCWANDSSSEYRCYIYDHENDTWTRVDGAPCPNSREGSCLRLGVDKNGVGQYAICHARSDRANIVVYFGTDTTSSSDPTEKAKGISWDWTKYITLHKEETGGGYSSMCMVDDTTLGILYESKYGAADDGGCAAKCRMYFTRIDVSDKVVPTAK